MTVLLPEVNPDGEINQIRPLSVIKIPRSIEHESKSFFLNLDFPTIGPQVTRDLGFQAEKI